MQEILNRRWLFYGLLFISILSYVFVFELVPSVHRVSELYAEMESTNAKLALIDNADSQQEYLRGVLASRGDTYRSIFNGNQVAGTSKVLSEIHACVGRSGVTLGTLIPSQKINHNQFSEWTIHITASGGFHNHAFFLNELERSNLLIRLNQVRLESDGIIPSDVRANYVFRVYFLTQDEDFL